MGQDFECNCYIYMCNKSVFFKTYWNIILIKAFHIHVYRNVWLGERLGEEMIILYLIFDGYFSVHLLYILSDLCSPRQVQ